MVELRESVLEVVFERSRRSCSIPVGHGVHWCSVAYNLLGEYHRILKTELIHENMVILDLDLATVMIGNELTYSCFFPQHQILKHPLLSKVHVDAGLAVTTSTRMNLDLQKYCSS